MFQKTKFLLIAVFLMLWVPSFACANPSGTIPNVSREMLNAGFWINKIPNTDEIIMHQFEIAKFNTNTQQSVVGVVYDLNAYPSSLPAETLTNIVTKRPFPEEDRYINDLMVDKPYYENLKKQMNLTSVGENNDVNYALTVRRTNIRTFPTGDVSFSEPNDLEFDMFQETAVNPAEAVLVLHKSLDGEWYLVQAYNYLGWIPAADLAITESKTKWAEYVNAAKFLLVTDNKLSLGFNPYTPEISELELYMGTKLPLVDDEEMMTMVDNQSVAGNYAVKLPVRGIDGELTFKTALIPVSEDVSEGYLPYTRANIIKQAFKAQGERYGWGGMHKARDCSAYVMDIYKCFGFLLPRNTDEQELTAGKTVQFEDTLSTEQRSTLIDNLQPGAVLHTNTHEMLYLGKHNGNYYVIHDITSYGDKNNKKADGSLAKITLNEIVVTDLSLPLRRSGKQFIDALTVAKQIEFQTASKDTLPENDIIVYLNDSFINFPDQKPFIDKTSNRLYVPIRFVTEAMGGTVNWVGKENKIVVSKADKQINMVIGSKNVDVNGSQTALDAPVVLVDNRAMVPLRFISNNLGAEVKWTATDTGGRVDIRYNY